MDLGRREPTKSEADIKLAYAKGYRVTVEGILLNSEGSPMKVQSRGKRYPTFSVCGEGGRRDRRTIRVHRFAAFCFYGEDIFEDKILVRHLNGDVLDYSRSNIALGTQFDNMADIPLERQREMSEKKRKWCLKTGKRPPVKRKLTEEQDVEIIRRLLSGESIRSVAKDFDVHHSTIQYVKIRKGLFGYGEDRGA